MSPEPAKPFRSWVGWIIAGVWILTALAVFIATRMHPATDADIRLSVSEFPFLTDSRDLLRPSNEEQLLVSGLGSMRIQFKDTATVSAGGKPLQAELLQIQGEPSASCSLYLVRSSGFELDGKSNVTLAWIRGEAGQSFAMKVHGPLSGSLTSSPGQGDQKPGFECRRVRVNGSEAGNLEGSFSPQGGDSIFLTTSDSRLDFVLPPQSEIGNTQIPILEELRLYTVDPRTHEPKTVLLKNKNEVVFEKLKLTRTINDADLLTVSPEKNFYLRQFTVKDGVHLSLHGVIRDIRAGAGPGDMESLMPSAFDHLDNAKRIYGVIPALVAMILGVLEKLGWLGKK